jgi:hypothetical protein
LIHQRVTRSIAFVLLGKNKPGGIAQGLLFFGIARRKREVDKKVLTRAGDP